MNIDKPKLGLEKFLESDGGNIVNDIKTAVEADIDITETKKIETKMIKQSFMKKKSGVTQVSEELGQRAELELKTQ